MLVVLAGGLIAMLPAAEAATCKGGKRADSAGRCKATPVKKASTKVKAKAGKKGKKATAAAPDNGALYVFIESGGCRVLATESSVRRMQEIAVGGSVTWDGRCAEGLISGTGVLRQEGVFIEGGRSKHFAYYYSGRAKNGVRTGPWTRESLERFDDSVRSWTSLARVEFVNGVAKGAPKPIPVRGADQHTSSFTTRVLEPEAKRAQAIAETTTPTADADLLRLRAAANVTTLAPAVAPAAPPVAIPKPLASAPLAPPKPDLPATVTAASPTVVLAAPKASAVAPAPSAEAPATTVPPQPVTAPTVAAPSKLAASLPTPPAAVAPAPTSVPADATKALPAPAPIPQALVPPAPSGAPKPPLPAIVAGPPAREPEAVKAAASKPAPAAPSPAVVPPLAKVPVADPPPRATVPLPTTVAAVTPAPTPVPAAVPKSPPAAAPVVPQVATQVTPPKLAVVAPPPTVAAVKLTPALPDSMDKQAFGFGTGCYMDTLDGQLWESALLTVKDRKSLRIDGWAVDDEERVLAEATYLRLEGSNGRRYYAATTVQERPDVARHFGNPAFVKAGYRAAFSAEGVPPGEYEATVVMSSKGRNLLCGNGRRLKL